MTAKSSTSIHGRATALSVQGFLLNTLGHVIHTNAIAWDVHAAQHTKCAQLQYAQLHSRNGHRRTRKTKKA